jgi:hypothetical protein
VPDPEPAHDDVPGAHAQRSAEHDDAASLPDEGDSIAAPARDQPSPTQPTPPTGIEKVDTSPSHGEVPGTLAYELRAEDAVPDIVVAPGGRGSVGGSPELLSWGGSREEEPDLAEEAKDGLGMAAAASGSPD